MIRKSTVYMYRAAGYVIMLLGVISMFQNTATVNSTPFLVRIVIFTWVGDFLTNFKQKLFPLSRAENIFSKTFAIILLVLLVLAIVLLIIAAMNRYC